MSSPLPGYGDEADGTEDVGYGDEAPSVDAFYVATLDGDDVFEGVPMYSDEGGHVVTLVGDWPSRGPFRVLLFDATGRSWGTAGSSSAGAFGGTPALGIDCYADRSRKRLRFALPALPCAPPFDVTANYGVRVLEGATVIAEREEVLLVVPRNRPWPEAYSLAKNLGFYGTRAGAFDPRSEDPASDANRPPYSPWKALARAFGRSLRAVSGSPVTRVRGDHAAGATELLLETVLAFSPAGGLWVDGKRIRYRGRVVVDELLADPIRDAPRVLLVSPLEEGVPGDTPVVFDAKGAAHPGIYAEILTVASPMVGP